MTKKLEILVDLDGIVVDLTTHWLELIERDHGIKVGLHEIDQWSLHKCGELTKLGATKVYDYLQLPGLFRNAPPLTGAIESLRELNELHDVVICSSPSGPVSAKEKLEWLSEHTPFLKLNQIILANKKTMVCGDVLIDDHPETGAAYRKRWPKAMVLGIQYEYNIQAPTEPYWHLYFEGYQNPAKAWKEIMSKIETHAHLMDIKL